MLIKEILISPSGLRGNLLRFYW